jgi:epoxyqueuosine reductase QueG
VKHELLKLAKECGADLVGVAPASRFPADHKIFRIYPQVKSVIGLAFRCLRGSYRGTEEGTTYYQYTTMSVENMEETVMPIALVRLANRIESKGFTAVPQRRHQTIMEAEDGMNPEVAYDAIARGRVEEPQFDFTDAAVRCGLGERGFHGALLTDDFGPMQRTCFILTDAELEPDQVVTPHLCDRCGACVRGCPGKCVDPDSGKVDPWRCAVYYNGANGTKNPFMPPEAFPDFEDRLAIIAGEAEIDSEKAKRILDAIYFYPPAQHSYTCSICGRACDVTCYCHLEKKGVLKRTFKTPFRTRPEWKFRLDDFAPESVNARQE